MRPAFQREARSRSAPTRTPRRGVPRRGLTILCLAAAILVPAAVALADEAAAIVKCGILYGKVKRLGFTSGLRIEDTDTLKPGELKMYETVLYAGTRYAFFAASDDHIRDLDIYIYDKSGNLLAHDSDNSDMPIAILAPRATGQVNVIVMNFRGDTGAYHVAMAMN